MKMSKINFLFFFLLAYTYATAQTPSQKSGNNPSFTAPIRNSPITNNTGDNPIFNINYADTKTQQSLNEQNIALRDLIKKITIIPEDYDNEYY